MRTNIKKPNISTGIDRINYVNIKKYAFKYGPKIKKLFSTHLRF